MKRCAYLIPLFIRLLSPNRRSWPYFLGFVLPWCGVFMFTPPSMGETGDLMVGIYANAPILMPEQGGGARGIVPEILAHMAAKEKWRITYRTGTWQECLDWLARGEIDLLPAIAVSEERLSKYDFNTESLLMNWAQVYTGDNAPLETLLDLSGKRIAVVTGDIYYEQLKRIERPIGIQPQYSEVESYAAVLDQVQSGLSDAGIVPRIFGAYNEDNYRIQPTPVNFLPLSLHFAVPKGQGARLIGAIDRNLVELKAKKNSIYYRSINYWTEGVRTISFPAWLNPLWIFTGITSVLTLVVTFNFLLRRQIRVHTEQLRKTIQAREKMESALRVAHGIQMDLVPQRFSKNKRFDLFGVLQPARQVGGDFYDYFLLDPDHLFFVIGDVSDKGIPAALFMARVLTLLSAAGRAFTTPEEIVQVVNREVCRNNDSMMFATVFMGMLTLSSGEFSFVNAGHNPPLVVAPRKAVQELGGAKNTALGIDSDAVFHQSVFQLAHGEKLILYTDGVTEAFSEEQQLFTEDRLMGIVSGQASASAKSLVSHILAEVRSFTGAQDQTDDIAIMVIDYP